MEKRSHHNTRWNYFLSIEQDLEKVSRFIEFSKENFSTYSIELSRILMASCAELDVLFKQLCSYKEPESSIKNINDYERIMKKYFPEIGNLKIISPRYGLILSPFSDWLDDETAIWWSENNKIKHQRDTYFHLANLINCLNATAALFWINIQVNYEIYNAAAKEFGENYYPPSFGKLFHQIKPKSSLFQLNDLMLYMGD